MAKTRRPQHNPFRGFVDMMSEMNRAQSHWMLNPTQNEDKEGRSNASAYVPPADIFALGDDLVIRCEIPGVRSDQVFASVSSGVLTISGYRDSDLDDKEVTYYARERVYGEFRRSMILPEGIHEKHVVARASNGLLEVTIKGGAATHHHDINIEHHDD